MASMPSALELAPMFWLLSGKLQKTVFPKNQFYVFLRFLST